MKSRVPYLPAGLIIPLAILCMVLPVKAENMDDCAMADRYANEIAPVAQKLDLKRMALAKAVELCPQDQEYRRRLAGVLEKMVVYIVQDLNSMAGESETDFSSKLEWKDDLLDSAVQQYEKLSEAGETDHEIWLGLARMYYLQGRYNDAAGACEQALSKSPDNDELKSAINGLKKMLDQSDGDFKNSQEILAGFKSAGEASASKYMGFKDETALRSVVCNRQRFNNILFAQNSALIKSGEAKKQLKEIGRALKSKGLDGYKFIVEGHTDNRGGEEHNMRLSRERARAVKEYLVEEFKVQPNRIVTRGFGFKRPRVPNDGPDHRRLNRRVEIDFVGRADQ